MGKIRITEEHFIELTENIDEVLFVMEADFRETLFVNPAYEKMWGRSCQSLYDNPRSYLDAVLHEDRPSLEAYLRRVRQGEKPGKLQFRIVGPNNEQRWILLHAVPLRDDEGKVNRISGLALDITEIHKARAALVESLDRYRGVTEASFDGIAITQDSVILEV